MNDDEQRAQRYKAENEEALTSAFMFIHQNRERVEYCVAEMLRKKGYSEEATLAVELALLTLSVAALELHNSPVILKPKDQQ